MQQQQKQKINEIKSMVMVLRAILYFLYEYHSFVLMVSTDVGLAHLHKLFLNPN